VGAFHGDAEQGVPRQEDAAQAGGWYGLSGTRVVYDAKVLEGRDGYLFMADDNNEVLAQHSGRLRLGEAELEGWRRALERRTQELARRDCAHVVMIAPNNHSVYPEMLPGDVESAPERPVHQLIEHLERCGSPVKLVYPLDEMVAAKPDHQICSRVDSHWTDYGAFLAYLRLMEDARQLVPTRDVGMDDVVFVDVDVQGDLGEKLDPPREATQPFGRLRYRNARLVYDNCVEGTGALAVTACGVAPPTTCLLLGDSYSYVLARFMSECWRRLALVHSPTLDPQVVDALGPDIAVTVIAERFLIAVPDDEQGRAMSERERHKREHGRFRPPLMHWIWPMLQSPTLVEVMRARLLAEGRTCDAALIGVMAYAGLRPAEAMALRWSAVGDEDILVEPQPNLRQATGEPRRVPLWRPLADDLEAWRKESGGRGRRLVFSAPGRPWTVDWRDWRVSTYPDLARYAGLQSTVPNHLRDVFCVLLIESGAPAAEVAALAGVETAVLEETFRGLLTDSRRTRARPVEAAISEARAAAAR
jgi:hypothetical protein